MDWDSDGDKDLITGGSYDDGRIKVYLNTGTDAEPVFSGFSYLQVGGDDFRPGVRSMPEVTDWNNDGLFDLLCGIESFGRVYLLINEGDTNAPLFNSASFVQNNGSDLSYNSAYRCSPLVMDRDKDGKKDLLLGNTYGTIHFYRNTGQDNNPQFTGYQTLQAGGTFIDVGTYSRPTAVDWDGDGLEDLLIGNALGEVWLFLAVNPALPFLELADLSIDDDDGDGFLEESESATITCTLTNLSVAASNVQATLVTDSPWCTITQGSWNPGDIAGGAAASNSAVPFTVEVSAGIAPGQVIPFRIEIESNDGNYVARHEFSGAVVTPQMELVEVAVNDMQGNSNGVLNAGEQVFVVISVTNSDSDVENAKASLSVSSPYVTIDRAEAELGAIPAGSVRNNAATPFVLSVSTGAPPIGVYKFEVALSYPQCSEIRTASFFIGEYIADDTAVYVAQDMTGATNLPLSAGGHETVPLPFTFPFYGREYDQICVTCNGLLLLENASTYNVNYLIPQTGQPNGLIAPYWDYLYPDRGGEIRHKSFESSSNRTWVAEWFEVPHGLDGGSNVCSVQAILYEDGRMVFQYGESSGTYAGGASATIGIESPSGLSGLLYSFNTVCVSNGDAIAIYARDTLEDTDADGLPDDFERLFLGTLSTDASADPDDDGASNLLELQSITDPADSNSVLRIDAVDLGGGSLVLHWPCVRDLGYEVWRSADLVSGAWTNLTLSTLTGPESTAAAYTTSVDTVTGFYRVRVP